MIFAENLQERINQISQRLQISKKVKVCFSRLVDVPCIIGYAKPILLLPITLTFQLSAEEIEVIFLHELSHVKNNDYLANLIPVYPTKLPRIADIKIIGNIEVMPSLLIIKHYYIITVLP